MRSTYMTQSKAAKAMGRSLPISTKVAVEIAAYLRGKDLEKAIASMERVIRKQEAIPYRRFNASIGHKPGPLATGRYPVKAATEFLKLLRNAKANAATSGMTGDLKIIHIAANRAAEPMRGRAKFRHTAKRTHVELMVGEPTAKTKKAPTKAIAPKAAPAAGAAS